MKNYLSIKNGIVIPESELEITTSRAGGPGGQHVNKTDTRITVRWNVLTSIVLSDAQKSRVLQNLKSRVTNEGDLIVHNSESRSQQNNKEAAIAQLVVLVKKGLHVPKKRIKTRIPASVKESRLKKKSLRGEIKKMRSKKDFNL